MQGLKVKTIRYTSVKLIFLKNKTNKDVLSLSPTPELAYSLLGATLFKPSNKYVLPSWEKCFLEQGT